MNRFSFRSWSSIALLALAWAFGSEALRALLPLLVFGIRDRFRWSALGGIGSIYIGAIALSLFALSFLAGPLRRALGPRRTLGFCVVLLAVGRLGIQLWSGDPLGHVLGVALVVLALMLLLPSALHLFGGTRVAFGVLTGVAVDTALHGALSTYDLGWRNDFPSLFLTLLLLAALLFFWRQSSAEPRTHSPTPGFLRWSVFGPFLFLQLLVLGNLSRLTVLTDWSQEMTFLVLLFGQVLALVFALLSFKSRPSLIPPALVFGAVLASTLLVPWPRGAMAALLVVGGQAQAALLLLWALGVGTAESQKPDRSGAGNGLGMMLLAIIFFLYYGGYDLTLPFPNTALPPVAAAWMGLAAMAAGRSRPERTADLPSGFRLAVPAACLLLIPIARWVTAPPPPVLETSDAPLRVMTYNLHCGYNPDGLLTLEEQAQAIEEQGADVVALQEVSRGWVINGSVDLLTWLERRLGMEAVFAPTAGPLWGNAILSRRPLTAVQRRSFEHTGVHLHRGLVKVEIPLGSGEPLRLINTHYHQRQADSHIRVEESQAVLDFWRGRPRTVFVGDLNATPESPEMELLRSRGFQDVLDLAGIDPGYTFRTGNLKRRLDYIWITPDLIAQDAVVSPSEASDHLGIAVTLAPLPGS